MLTHLHIRNLAVIDEVELELDRGFSVLTGETGAGKSILFDALDLCLGSRADSSAVRSGADRAEISASFDISQQPGLRELLRQQELEADDDCLLRRVVGADGRSRAWVNGRPVPLQVLRDVGSALVDICGQQTHQSLRHRGVQRTMLDSHGELGPLAAEVAAAHQAWQAATDELERLRERHDDREQQLALLRHQLDEISALNPQPGELTRLEQERQLVTHAARLTEGLNLALFRLYEQDGSAALDSIAAASRLLDELQRFDPALAAPLQALGQATIQLQEAVEQLRERLDRLEHDPARQDQLENRVAALRDLARRHRIEADELPVLAERLTTELETLEHGSESLAELEARAQTLHTALRNKAAALSKARQQAAAELEGIVMQNLQALGMEAARFAIRLSPRPDGEISANGAEQVEFLVSANPGQAAGPIARVASGGELSRLNLAIQVSAMGRRGIPVLLFDEVDAGVGGGVAEIVGRKLRALSKHAQVLCVTHLAQVASQATHHFRVSKHISEEQTHTTVEQLDGRERVEETARMLGGVKITAQTRAHAREMLKSAAA